MDLSRLPAKNMIACNTVDEVISRIRDVYYSNIKLINDNFKNIISNSKNNKKKVFGVYPYVAAEIRQDNLNVDANISYGVAIDAGIYGTTVTDPDVFDRYYRAQFESIIDHHKIPIFVGESNEEIPFPFADEGNMSKISAEDIVPVNKYFAWPNLSKIDDNIANNTKRFNPAEDIMPLSLFPAERVDYSLHRLHHYTGTAPKHFQKFILLTNYQRYINEFIDYAKDQVLNGDEYSSFVMPGDYELFNDKSESGDESKNLPQMPAYHLKRKDGQGITFINIGVGPSNAKTITDHLAVLRPHCWLMLGHCAGLRRSQMLGDYVLAHAYAREDHVLNNDLPLETPIPAIAEIQMALQEAVANVTKLEGSEMKSRMRTGTVLTTDNRNWELCFSELFSIFQQTRTIAVDMESATIAANGFRFRVPYGTLLCVSDKPIHGEIKLRSTADSFYQERIKQHLIIGIEAVRLLRNCGAKALHSRKLRGFEEPPMR